MSATAQPAVDADIPALYRKYLTSGKARMSAMLGGQVEISSKGSVVTDAKGDEYLNCGGYGVFLLGHCHPRVVDAVRAQVEQHPLSTRLLLDPTQALAAQALATLTPEGMDRIYFATSGADAVEAALKLARMHGKTRVVSTIGGFHGKTFGALSVSGNPTFREPFEPLVPGVTYAPHGDAGALRAELARTDGDACVILEPIQGEGGCNIPPEGYLRGVADACSEHDALLIVDEIATGLGRTGDTWWHCQKEGVTPDIILFGKPISGGIVPVSGLAATEEAFAPLDRDPFMHSATFSGSPIAMAAVMGTVDALVEERVPERARELGDRLMTGMREVLAEGFAAGVVREVRGAGLMMGIEFCEPAYAGHFEIELVSRKIIPNHCLNSHATVRLTPPAILTDEEVDWLLRAVEDSGRAVVAHRQAHARRA